MQNIDITAEPLASLPPHAVILLKVSQEGGGVDTVLVKRDDDSWHALGDPQPLTPAEIFDCAAGTEGAYEWIVVYGSTAIESAG